MNLIFRSNHAHPMRWKRRVLVKPKGEFGGTSKDTGRWVKLCAIVDKYGKIPNKGKFFKKRNP